MPKILKVSLSNEEENQIFDSLIERFDLNKSDVFGKGQDINFPITEEIEVWSKLELYSEGSIEPETNANVTTEQSVVKFTIGFYIDGEEIEVVMDQRSGSGLEDRISNHYRIN